MRGVVAGRAGRAQTLGMRFASLRLASLLVVCSMLGGCPPSGAPATDAGADAADTSPSDVGPDAPGGDAASACAGSEEGFFTCTPSQQCCGGVWVPFLDGPCLPHDGGVPMPDCSNPTPQPTCPCPTEGMTACRAFSTSLRCEGGAWVETPNVACCP